MPIIIDHAAAKAAEIPADARKAYIKSYGCQMNVYDALRMGELLKPHGYALVDAPDDADLVVYNTCHIREKADEKVFSDLGRFKVQAKADALHAVGGCTGQALGRKIMQRDPRVNIVFGPQSFHRLPEFIEHANRQMQFEGKSRVVDIDFPLLEKFDALPPAGAYGPMAFVTIQEGCDKFCTYCVVPYTRGQELSRSQQSILDECKTLRDQGVKEVCLIGQNVNAYHGENVAGQEVSFADLIESIAEIDGIERIRFTTSHPMNTEEELIQLFATQPKLMPYFHLPVQSGSNKILAAMNRTHTAESYLETVQKIKAVRPDIAMSGDFIVGFPGETEEDFQQTLAIVAATGYATAYSFAYSPRPGTPAAAMQNQVDEAVKKERLAGLQALINDEQQKFLHARVGETVNVLVEETGRNNGELKGRTPHNLSVSFVGDESLVGEIVPVHITGVNRFSLAGDMQIKTAA